METIQLKTGTIDVTLPVTIPNLDIIINIIDNIKNEGNGHSTPQTPKIESIENIETKMMMRKKDVNPFEQKEHIRYKKYKRNKPRLFKEKDRICAKGTSHNISLYRPILNYLKKNLPTIFSRKTLADTIKEFYEQKNWKIKKCTAQVYSCEYRKYMLKNNIIKQLNDNDFELITKKEKQPETKTILQKTFSKPPPNTSLFYTWIDSLRKDVFNIDEFIRKYPKITKESALKIFSYSIEKNVILQLSHSLFKICRNNQNLELPSSTPKLIGKGC